MSNTWGRCGLGAVRLSVGSLCSVNGTAITTPASLVAAEVPVNTTATDWHRVTAMWFAGAMQSLGLLLCRTCLPHVQLPSTHTHDCWIPPKVFGDWRMGPPPDGALVRPIQDSGHDPAALSLSSTAPPPKAPGAAATDRQPPVPGESGYVYGGSTQNGLAVTPSQNAAEKSTRLGTGPRQTPCEVSYHCRGDASRHLWIRHPGPSPRCTLA